MNYDPNVLYIPTSTDADLADALAIGRAQFKIGTPSLSGNGISNWIDKNKNLSYGIAISVVALALLSGRRR